MELNDKIRIDKWLWAVRIFKTRTMATNACKNSKISVNGIQVKPSHPVKIGEEIELKSSFITRRFKVKGLIENRVSAKLAVDNVEEITPLDELEKLRTIKTTRVAFRERGTGRPTKKERRQTDQLQNEELFGN